MIKGDRQEKEFVSEKGREGCKRRAVGVI